MACAIFGLNPVYELGEVADLIKGVPDWKLEIALGGAWGQGDLDLDNVLLR